MSNQAVWTPRSPHLARRPSQRGAARVDAGGIRGLPEGSERRRLKSEGRDPTNFTSSSVTYFGLCLDDKAVEQVCRHTQAARMGEEQRRRSYRASSRPEYSYLVSCPMCLASLNCVLKVQPLEEIKQSPPDMLQCIAAMRSQIGAHRGGG